MYYLVFTYRIEGGGKKKKKETQSGVLGYVEFSSHGLCKQVARAYSVK
jgi:hypothetical protein